MKERIRGDRRTKNRFELVGSLPGTLETWHRHKVRNLSPGGALVESMVPLPAGSRLSGRLLFQGSQREVKAEVRHTEEDGGGRGTGRYLIGLAWADGMNPVDDVVGARDGPLNLSGERAAAVASSSSGRRHRNGPA